MSDRLGVVVIGGGQAGLATSRELSERSVDHVVLERGRVGQTWRGRWDTFCLVTPNWSMQLPGQPYDGADPDAFDPRDEIVGFLERYGAKIDVPIREGVDVTSLEQRSDGSFVLDSSAGRLEASGVVLATGAYQRPHRPAGAASLPSDLLQIDVEQYERPDALPPGPILVIGSGQSGCQLAEELHQAGRVVFLACGRAPWLPRRIGGRDLFWWGVESGFMDASVSTLPDPKARLAANILASGYEGGHDLHLRTLDSMGVRLLGHFAGSEGRRALFATDLAESLAWGDERYVQLRDLITTFAADAGLQRPELPDPEPMDCETPESVDLTGFGAVVFAGGFRPDYGSWVKILGAFDELGFPVQVDGVSTVADGLYFVGVHFLRKRKSSLFIGVGEDAAVVAEAVAARQT